MLYFAYGSNLLLAQMQRRCPDAHFVATARYCDHRLVFGNWSQTWQGGVASIEPCKGSIVEGALYRLSRRDVQSLDRCEGVPTAYVRKRRTVTAYGEPLRAHVYMMCARRAALPSLAYVHRIVSGYEALSLDPKNLMLALRECVNESQGGTS